MAETIVINNFVGRLTRYLNGDLNSGFAKFSTSWGYDPFSKPGNLTWLYQPTNIAGTTITDVALAAKIISPTSKSQQVYTIGNNGRLYEINPTNSPTTNTLLFDSPSLLANIGSIAGTFQRGADLNYFLSKLHISSDARITKVNLDGSAIASVTGTTSVTNGIFHPLIQFQGKLYYGNGNNIGEIDSTGNVSNGAKLSPALPTGMYISDLDVTPNGDYMIITASYQFPYDFGNTTTSPVTTAVGQQYAVDSYTFYWNGTDAGVTAFEAGPSFPSIVLSTFLDKNYSFVQDAFGMGLYEGRRKILTLPQNLIPMPNGVAPNGTFMTWVSPESTGAISNADPTADDTYASLYYFGKLDDENPAGLWRVARIRSGDSGYHTFRAPLNMLVNNNYQNLQTQVGWGKHYISTWEWNNSTEDSNFYFYRWVLPPSADTNPLLGVYETQTQLFSKRIEVSQIRVYTEATVANNSFRVDVISVDGTSLFNSTYTFAAGTDTTLLQGAQERINFNPAVDVGYGFGIRITNAGTVNMTIKKIEVDWSPKGR